MSFLLSKFNQILTLSGLIVTLSSIAYAGSTPPKQQTDDMAVISAATVPSTTSAMTPVTKSITTTTGTADLSIPDELLSFFSGNWSGKGEFASGKKIEADVSFAADLNKQWLLYRHTDRLPNEYKSLGMWGIERNSKKLVMTINDSFAGARLFVSEGWQNGRIEFSDSIPISPVSVDNSRRERFIFEKLANDKFKMTYESSTNGAPWKLGDYLIFTKTT